MKRGSIAMEKSRWDIGQPWRVPLERGKYSDLWKLVDKQAVGAEYKSCTEEINLDAKFSQNRKQVIQFKLIEGFLC